ncbi:MAG: hypothetical protein Q4G03_01285 [Planctomycetia bacterium]|nr:hypothetical protein [Planctomycetia bacterium]
MRQGLCTLKRYLIDQSNAQSLQEIFQGDAAMLNGNVKEFVDNLYYGAEMYYIYREKKYFIQGW